jgi:hypothetical protein
VLEQPLALGHAVALFQIAARAEDFLAGAGKDDAANLAGIDGQPRPEVQGEAAK